MKKARIYILTALACMATLAGCSSDDGGQSTGADFDRQAMLTNYADSLIIPGYQHLSTATAEMVTAINQFAEAPAVATLATARQKYQAAYLAWQQVSMYEFGPADELMLRTNLNTFPTTTSQIESNIASGTYDLQTAANISAKGFPALDYLLYSRPTDAEVVNQYTSSANRANYLQDITLLVNQLAQNTYSGWTDQNYRNTFKQSAGTAVGSAAGNLVNELNSDIDLAKRAKVGIPAGKFTDTPLPEKVEAYYSHTSLAQLVENLEAEKRAFLGMAADGTNGTGLDDYLNHVDARKGNMLLSDAIEQQFNLAIAAAEAITSPLSEAVTSDPAAVTKVYDELQKLIVLTKTDLPSKLGVTITYSDNDGD